MGKKEFERLSEQEKQIWIHKSLAWFCVSSAFFNPQTQILNSEEISVIKIVLGERLYKNV